MGHKKKSPKTDGQIEDLPQKKVSKEDAAQVKGGAGGAPFAKIEMSYKPTAG